MSREIVKNLKFKQVTHFDGDKFSKFLEEQYLKSNRSGDRTKTTFSPSSIGGYNGLCPRYWYLAFTGVHFDDDNDALGIANMAAGTAAHSRIEKLMTDSGIPVDIEVEIKHQDPPIRGFVDMMIEWEGDIVVGEFKTTRQEVFMIRQATMKPSVQHLIQLLIYLEVTQKKSGFLLYENKNTNEILCIPVEMNARNKKILNDVFDWLRLVHKNFTEGELPKRPYTKRNKICKSCPVFEVCWNQQPDGEVAIAPMEVPTI